MSHILKIRKRFETLLPLFAAPIARFITLLFICTTGVVMRDAVAGDIQLAWDPVADARVDHYEVHYGPASGQYENQVATASTSGAVAGLQPGQTYYFAARACAQDELTCSAFSNEVSATVPYPAPVAGLAADVVVGTAPLAVSFADRSTGLVTGWNWELGDGTGATIQSPQHTYTVPGTYSVILTVTGPGGTNSATQAGYIQVLAPPPVADFAATTRSGVAPLTTTFSDLSSGAVSARSWTFGDGGTSTAPTAVYTYTAPGLYAVSLRVSGAGGEDTEIKSAYIEVKPPAPVADFSGDVLKGPAPLTVAFQNASTGQITSSSWAFGDSSTSSQTSPIHTYTQPGLYSVTLSVSGPGGTGTRTRSSYVEVEAPELPMEVGEILVRTSWQRVNFNTRFSDPILVAKSLSNNDSAPAVVRVKGIDATGFWIRLQEWNYLDGLHAMETVSYMVMERGRHQLPDGARVEAGRLTASAAAGRLTVSTAKATTTRPITFVPRAFSTPFAAVPVVFAAVTSTNESDAVDTRMRNITAVGFEVGMQEQESSNQAHLQETIDYIAWEPSFGVVNGLRYEVGFTDTGVTNQAYSLLYPSVLAQAPLFLADMQTTANTDTANLRWNNRNEVALDVWVSEERSKDTEVTHPAESVGYFVAAEEQ